MKRLFLVALATAAPLTLAGAQTAAPSKEAIAFGSRGGVQSASLSPDGKAIAIVRPVEGRGTSLVIVRLSGNPQVSQILRTSGTPEKLTGCGWSTNTRLICNVFVLQQASGKPEAFTRLISLNLDGTEIKQLSARATDRDLGVAHGGGSVVDWLGEEQGSVLMTRYATGQQNVGHIILAAREGLGVDRVDTTSLTRKIVEQPNPRAIDYISDGRGKIRIMATQSQTNTGYDGNRISYFYRKTDSREWLPLGESVIVAEGLSTGFSPVAVDPDLNVTYGYEAKGNHTGLYKVALDGSLKKELVFERPDTDIDELVEIGRQHRVVGVGYAKEKRKTEFFDAKLRVFGASLSKALPAQPLVSFVDASADENSLLLWAGSDADPGKFYLFDKTSKSLGEVMAVRPELAKMPLANVKPITFPAADGTMIPGYLTLPPGSDGKNLPAIVMPHGGPAARDEWTFDWLPQFFASRGYAVLQPNYRGSTGYGEAWFQKNGFQSWHTAIGDVDDGGRWLVKQGIAAPDKMAIVGWSYGGYAALQSEVLDPGLFKAVVAVAPVTDLQVMVDRRQNYSDYKQLQAFVGKGPHVIAGSPARNVDKIKVPVLLFHGDLDLNVAIEQSRIMASRLKDAGGNVQLVEYKGLDHQLDDNQVRTELLDKSDKFLRQSMGM